MAAVRQNGRALRYVDDASLRYDRDVLAAAGRHGRRARCWY